jgi:hypothetical protein
MSKTKITLKSLNTKVNILRMEIVKLRNLLFDWGEQNRKDIDKFKLDLNKEGIRLLDNGK